MTPRGYGRTDVGRERTGNEDAHLVDDALGVYAVADGMGGHAAGEIASAAAVAAVAEHLTAARSTLESAGRGLDDDSGITELVEGAIQAASAAVFALASSNAQQAGMGCTLTLLVITGDRAFMGHVGDSRLYVARGGELHQLSVDHTIPQELVRAGRLPPERAKSHPYAHVLSRCIGLQAGVEVDTLAFRVSPSDRFLLCSDGFADYVEDPAWLLNEMEGDFATLPARLCAHANESGGKDNITVVTVSVEADDDDTTDDGEMVLEVLSRVAPFDGMTLRQRLAIANAAKLVRLEPGDVLIDVGAELDALVLVVSGALQVTSPGLERSVPPGQSFGAAAMLAPRPSRAQVAATARSVVLTLDAKRLRRLARRRPRLGNRLLLEVAERLAVSVHSGGPDAASP